MPENKPAFDLTGEEVSAQILSALGEFKEEFSMVIGEILDLIKAQQQRSRSPEVMNLLHVALFTAFSLNAQAAMPDEVAEGMVEAAKKLAPLLRGGAPQGRG